MSKYCEWYTACATSMTHAAACLVPYAPVYSISAPTRNCDGPQGPRRAGGVSFRFQFIPRPNAAESAKDQRGRRRVSPNSPKMPLPNNKNDIGSGTTTPRAE